MVIKKGDIFLSYRENHPTERVMALMDYEKECLLYCTNKNGDDVFVKEHEIGEFLGNIEALNINSHK